MLSVRAAIQRRFQPSCSDVPHQTLSEGHGSSHLTDSQDDSTDSHVDRVVVVPPQERGRLTHAGESSAWVLILTSIAVAPCLQDLIFAIESLQPDLLTNAWVRRVLYRTLTGR